VDGVQRGDRLEFYQNSFLDQQLSRVGTDDHTIVPYGDRMLLIN
jgi:hypothetical protein